VERWNGRTQTPAHIHFTSFRAFSRSNEFQPYSSGQLELLMAQERAKTRKNTRVAFKRIQESWRLDALWRRRNAAAGNRGLRESGVEVNASWAQGAVAFHRSSASLPATTPLLPPQPAATNRRRLGDERGVEAMLMRGEQVAS
jgi:hypothetical protein